jgi:hypothetical protein
MPPRPVLLALLLLAVAPPFCARARGTGIGAFGMFARIERHHLELEVVMPSGPERFALARLAPHLSRDARQIVLPAAGYPLGADQIDLLAGGLGDLAQLACQLESRGSSARVRFYRGPAGSSELVERRVEVPCRED